jgi:hypothetical protein
MMMSNALSIVAVTAVLKDLLENGLVSDSITASVGDVLVTALPPDLIKVGTDERSQLNFFLYHVTQNRNVDWVSQEFRSKHSRVNKTQRSVNPPLALDLHYLLTAYGAKDFQAELLLGYAMQLLHTTTVITSDLIENALKNATTSNTTSLISQALAGVSISKLAEQIGQIKLSPEFLSMEDNSKIWSALQTHYRPSASYLASMVLIDSHEINYSESGNTGLWSEPNIEQVTALTQKQPIIFAGSNVIIRGKCLRGDITRIRLNKSEKLLVPEDIKETQINLKLPDDLSIGVQAIQVVHLAMGGEHIEKMTSNVAAVIVHPKISVSLHQVIDSAADLHAVEIAVKFYPQLRKTQRVVLLLNEISSPHTLAQSIVMPSPHEDTEVMNIAVKDIKPGTYLVRVQVDGVASPLEINQTGEYHSPQVTIP